MTRYQDATARQLDFGYEVERTSSERPSGEAGHHQLCEMCGRVQAHLYIPAAHGQQPAAVCLRCHHAVRQQKRMLRAAIKDGHAGVPAPSRLISSPVGETATDDAPVSPPSADQLYKELEHRRRRAQVAARKALGE
jgi:hypothetical protein